MALPEPVAKPPPWKETNTGFFAPRSVVGVQTFRFRQSSPMPAMSCRSHWISWPYSPRMSAWVCGQHWPKPKHSRTPAQDAAGLGGR
jgi:hypothetical protein